MSLFTVCKHQKVELFFDPHWVPAPGKLDASGVQVLLKTRGHFKEGYQVLLFETNHQMKVNYIFQSCGYQPLWLNEREFHCCVTQTDYVCTSCGKKVKNDRGMTRHIKVYHKATPF